MNKKPFHFSEDQRQMHAAWVKAARETRLEIPCKTVADARRLRFALYNAVKPLKDGKAESPDALAAAEQVTIHLYEEPSPMVLMQHKSATTMMQSLSAVLDGEVVAAPPVMTAEEVESLQRLQSLMAEAPEAKKNPYFTREDR